MHPEPSYSFQPQSSQYIELSCILMHGLAVIATAANTLPLLIKTIIFSTIVIHLCFYLHQIKHLKHHHIHFSDADGWSIGLNENPSQAVTLIGSSLSTRWLILLHFKTEKHPSQSLLIGRDSLSTHDYQRLRLMLKLHLR